MKNNEVINAIEKHKVVAVIRGTSAKDAIETAERLILGGIKLIEITFTTPNALDAIASLFLKYKNSEVIIGAGTVLNELDAKDAITAGAQFIVSPGIDEHIIYTCNTYGTAVFPGVYTPTEVMQAIKLGCTFLKLFPGNIDLLKALKGPFPQIKFMVTGGVNEGNLHEWLKVGATAVGAGTNLTNIDAHIKNWIV